MTAQLEHSAQSHQSPQSYRIAVQTTAPLAETLRDMARRYEEWGTASGCCNSDTGSYVFLIEGPLLYAPIILNEPRALTDEDQVSGGG